MTVRKISNGGGEGDGEEILWVVEGAGGGEGGVGQQGGDGGRGKFVTVFGVYCLALGKVEAEAAAGGVGGDGDGLGGEGFEVDFDTRMSGVPKGAVDVLPGAEEIGRAH